jgi:hypothetical protein
VQDIIPLRIHRQDQIVSGEAWRLYKESNPDCKFSDFWTYYCQYFSMCSFQLSWFFLQRGSYALTSEASSSHSFVKMEPLSPISGDCSFAYASDTIEERVVNRVVSSNFLSEISAIRSCLTVLL